MMPDSRSHGDENTAKRKMVAFNDRELRPWLMSLIVDRSSDFLGALAEAVISAGASDYGVIRPGLLKLKEKYGTERKAVPGQQSATLRPVTKCKQLENK